MNKYTFIVVLVFFFSGNLFSQNTDSLLYKYNNQTIVRFGGSFLKGSERLTFNDLSREFSKSDLGLDLYLKAKRNRTTSRILNLAGMVSGFAALGVLANNGNRNTAIVLYAGYSVFFATGIRYSTLSTQNLDRALWQRNKDVLFPQQQ